MMKKQKRTAILALLTVLGLGPLVYPAPHAKNEESGKVARVALASGATTAGDANVELRAGGGMAALEHAASLGKYAFIFFYRSDDEPTQRMPSVFDAARVRLADRALPMPARATDPAQKPIVNKHNLSPAPAQHMFSVAAHGDINSSYPSALT